MEYEALASVTAQIHRLNDSETEYFVNEMTNMKGALVNARSFKDDINGLDVRSLDVLKIEYNAPLQPLSVLQYA